MFREIGRIAVFRHSLLRKEPRYSAAVGSGVVVMAGRF
jgi:hypothetical protein